MKNSEPYERDYPGREEGPSDAGEPRRPWEHGRLRGEFVHEAREFRGPGGGSLGGLLGLASAVFAILGLVGIWPRFMGPIATIGIGAALVSQGSAFAGTLHDGEAGRNSTEVMGGVAGIVLGALALLGIATGTLLAIAPIVLGGAMIAGSGAREHVHPSGGFGERISEYAHEARRVTKSAAGIQLLVGFAAAVLGVLALAAFAPMRLEFLALLALGAGVLLSNTHAGKHLFIHPSS